MTRTFAARTTPLALAALLTAAMLLATNALAAHQYRVASATPQGSLVTCAGERTARA
jgi:hypothetical protein